MLKISKLKITKDMIVYFIFLMILLSALLSYTYVFNRNGRIEHYYYENDRVKFTLLQYMIRIINVVVVVYSRYFFMELIKLL